MPFCPECKAEYRPEFTRCSDCDVYLVERLPQDKASAWAELELQLVQKGINLTEAISMPSISAARMARDILFNEGIPCRIREEEDKETLKQAMLRTVIGMRQDIGVMVLSEHLEKARKILDDFFSEEYFSGNETEYLTCSECGAAVDVEDKVCPACGEPFEDEADKQ